MGQVNPADLGALLIAIQAQQAEMDQRTVQMAAASHERQAVETQRREKNECIIIAF